MHSVKVGRYPFKPAASIRYVTRDMGGGLLHFIPRCRADMLKNFLIMLKTVIFSGSRPGASYVANDQFVILSAADGQEIKSFAQWSQIIKAGARIQQAMVVSRVTVAPENRSSRRCHYSTCSGTISLRDTWYALSSFCQPYSFR